VGRRSNHQREHEVGGGGEKQRAHDGHGKTKVVECGRSSTSDDQECPANGESRENFEKAGMGPGKE